MLAIFSKLWLLLLFWIQDLPNDLKGRNESKKYCISSLASEFPENCKFYPAKTKDDIHKVLFVSCVIDAYFYLDWEFSVGSRFALTCNEFLFPFNYYHRTQFIFFCWCSSCTFWKSKGLKPPIGGANGLILLLRRFYFQISLFCVVNCWRFCNLIIIWCCVVRLQHVS